MIRGSTVCSSFKTELLKAIHDFSADQFWMALYTAGAPLGPDTLFYVPDGEAIGDGYLPGGQVMTFPRIFSTARTAYATFDDVVWSNSSISAAAALIYNQTKQQRAVAVLDFGATQVSNLGDFRVRMPEATPATALIRIL